jgi:hypothetical protein
LLRDCPQLIGNPGWSQLFKWRSGPSTEDIAVTEQLVLASKALDIELVDHLVIGDGKYISLKEKLRW